MNWIEAKTAEIDDILEVLPHRYPFLLVDRVLEIQLAKPVRMGMSEAEMSEARKGSFVRTVKNVTFNEAQFQGHFPGRPVFPGVLTLEAMAQSAIFVTLPFLCVANGGKVPKLEVALVSLDEVRFRRPIRPGDQMQMKITLNSVRGPIWIFEGEVTVDGKRAAEAKFMAHLNLQLGGH